MSGRPEDTDGADGYERRAAGMPLHQDLTDSERAAWDAWPYCVGMVPDFDARAIAEAEQDAEYAAQAEEMIASQAQLDDDRARGVAPQPAREARQ